MSKVQAPKKKLLDAALALIREKGFSAITVDDLCARAGATRGAFSLYFKSKDEVGVSAAKHWEGKTT